ncbi:MAG: DUF4258 domain-containing protein [Methanosarcinales archaeon Met12]|nr:MAG: DUF4258 domain-containing protein [Methanosarcinales archaeon Met12]
MQCEFQPSKHAKSQMVLRGISKREVLDCILKGAKRLQGKKVIGIFGKLEVVFWKRPCHYYIITTYWR